MYGNDDFMKTMMDMLAIPLFKSGLSQFMSKAQQEGLEAAKKFWGLSEYGQAFPQFENIYERLNDWYTVLGFVPSTKYAQVLDENVRLKSENQLLRNMIKDLQINLVTEGGEKVQQVWHEIIDKQIKMNAEVANTFFEAVRQFKANTEEH